MVGARYVRDATIPGVQIHTVLGEGDESVPSPPPLDLRWRLDLCRFLLLRDIVFLNFRHRLMPPLDPELARKTPTHSPHHWVLASKL